jgi:hypothetical protein
MGLKFNHIGTPGQMGFGVGVPATVPDGFALMDGTLDPDSDNYGNFVYQDGRVWVHLPSFIQVFTEPSKPVYLNPMISAAWFWRAVFDHRPA